MCGLGFILLASLTDGPFLTRWAQEGKERRAVVAIRDPEKPFMQWGTRLFTAPCLSRHYDRAYCFTQASKKDQKEEIEAALEEALRNYETVDIFLLAHSNRYHEWVAEMDENLRFQRLRLVYNTGCYNAKQGDIWLKLGAKTYIGHPGSSMSPPFYVFFTRRWVRGSSAREAYDQGNALAKRLFFRLERAVPSRMDAEKIWKNTKAVFFGDPEVHIADRPHTKAGDQDARLVPPGKMD